MSHLADLIKTLDEIATGADPEYAPIRAQRALNELPAELLASVRAKQ